MGFTSIHSHSRSATEKAWERIARYRTTVDGDRGAPHRILSVASLSLARAMTEADTSAIIKCPNWPAHHRSCRACKRSLLGLRGRTSTIYRSAKSANVLRFDSGTLK